jgi:DNA repair protein RecO (recombination protein O)
MEFTDEGIVLASRLHGETNAVVEIFTASHGRWAGLVYGGQGRRKGALLQPGNVVRADWKGRINESLGHFSLEIEKANAAEAMHDRCSLAGLMATCAVASACLPEREAHPRAYSAMRVLLSNFECIDIWPALMARWELGLLSELGFGLTLDRCAATGARNNLIYVSPRSACAVSAEAGEPYRASLLPLPGFLRGSGGGVTMDEAIAGLKTTGYFIETRVLHPANRQLPEARTRLAGMLAALPAAEVALH